MPLGVHTFWGSVASLQRWKTSEPNACGSSNLNGQRSFAGLPAKHHPCCPLVFWAYGKHPNKDRCSAYMTWSHPEYPELSTWNSIPAHSNSRAAFATIHMHIHWHLAYQCYNEVFGEHEHGWSQDAQAHSQCRSWSQRRLLKISWQCLFKRRYVWLVHGWHQTF